ncbi:MAG: hypothetical protein AAFY02_11785 [Pseudomonadota bacterium]
MQGGRGDYRKVFGGSADARRDRGPRRYEPFVWERTDTLFLVQGINPADSLVLTSVEVVAVL